MAEFTDIEKQLMERIAESRLRESLALIRNAVEDIWADDAPRIIQDHTDHGIHHSERLADYAAQLLAVNDGRPLSSEETCLLMAGIYLHDIGMQCDVVKYPAIKARAEALGAKFDIEFTAKTASSYTVDEQKAIRDNHHLLTAAWIDAAYEGETQLATTIGSVPEELVDDLIDVCKYHSKLPISSCPVSFTHDERWRKQLVAALVRFADELDVDGNRVKIETVKYFRLDPRNAVYWWLHNRTKAIPNVNVLTLRIRLNPVDKQSYGELVHEAFIERFRVKNRPVLSVLARNRIPIVISDESGVVADKRAKSLPLFIVRSLQGLEEEKSALDQLVEEVKTWLEAIGYELSGPKGKGPIRDMVATLQRGLMRQQVLVRCFEGEIVQADLEALEAEPSPQKWAISEMRVAPSAREYAEVRPTIQVFNLADFMRLIWGPYFDYLTALVEESDIPRYYVDLGCHRKETDEEGREIARDTYPLIDDYIDDWLSERGRLHISILGEFGTGKTWFCRHYAYRQLQCYLDDPIKERLPLLITLRAFTKAMTAQQLINDALLEQYKLPFVGSAFDVFQEMNRRGKLLLILDGFDEMARKVEYQTVVDNFWELAQVVVEGSKVLLTSRTEYFRWAKESEKVLGGEELGRRMIVIEPPKFEVLYLDPFSDEQIEEVIIKRVGPGNGPAVARRILDAPKLAALTCRPVLIELLLAVLPEIEAREEVNEAQVYLYATNELLLRNITAERTFTTTADKLFFLCELAWEMICSGELRIHYTDIPERIKAWFGDRIKDKPELDHWDYDLRNQTLLQRNAAGYYEFAHKSLAEYFVAYKFAAELGCLAPEFTQTYCEADGKPCQLPIVQKDAVKLATTFGALSLSDERMGAIRDLLPGMVGDAAQLWAVIGQTKGEAFEDVRYTGGNAATVLNRIGESFAEQDLRTTVLAGAHLEKANFANADLEDVSLREAVLREVDFSHANLVGATLRRAFLWSCTLEGAKLRNANLEDAHVFATSFVGVPVDDLLRLLEDLNAGVRMQAASALGRLGATEAIGKLIELLKDPNAKVRENAASALGNLEATEATGELIELLKDPNAEVRKNAASALGNLGVTEAIGKLIELLKDPNGEVRRNVASALGNLGATQAIGELIELLKDPNAEVIINAASALGRLEATEATGELIELLKDPNAEVRRYAASALGNLGATEATGEFIELLKDPNAEVRGHAASALGNLGATEAIGELIELLGDPNISVQGSVIGALGKIGTEEVRNPLLKLLRRGDTYTRIRAASALGSPGLADVRVIEALRNALTDWNYYVRASAATSLGKLGLADSEVVAALKPALKFKNPDVRAQVADALGYIGSADAIAALKILLEDSSSQVRDRAMAALEKIKATEKREN